MKVNSLGIGKTSFDDESSGIWIETDETNDLIKYKMGADERGFVYTKEDGMTFNFDTPIPESSWLWQFTKDFIPNDYIWSI